MEQNKTIKWEKLLRLFIAYIPEFAELVSISDMLLTSVVVQRSSPKNQSTVQFSRRAVLTIFIMDILSRGKKVSECLCYDGCLLVTLC